MCAYLDGVVGEIVGFSDMAIERVRIELRQDVDPVYPAVDAVAHGDVDEPIAPADRHLRINKSPNTT